GYVTQNVKVTANTPVPLHIALADEQKNSQVKQVGNQMTKKVGFSQERNRNRKDGQEWCM
ncbi:MAG: hypothetical protein ACFN00_07705, partial [Flavobacteriaceae bacterium]